MDFYSEEEIERRADRVAKRLMASGLPLTDKLVRSAARLEAERLMTEVEEAEIERDRVLRRNVERIQRRYRVIDRQIQREGAVFGVIVGLLGVLVFGLMCWLNARGGDLGIGLVMAVGALAFFVLAVLAVARLIAVHLEREGEK